MILVHVPVLDREFIMFNARSLVYSDNKLTVTEFIKKYKKELKKSVKNTKVL